MIREDLVIMCHEALTNEMDVLVNECALSYILFKETVQKENDCHCLFTILLTILNIMTSKMTNSSYDLYIIIFKVFWSHIIVLREKQTKLYVNNLQPNDNHSLQWTVNHCNWITESVSWTHVNKLFKHLLLTESINYIKDSKKLIFQESAIKLFSIKAGQDCQWVTIKVLNYYSYIRYLMASKDVK